MSLRGRWLPIGQILRSSLKNPLKSLIICLLITESLLYWNISERTNFFGNFTFLQDLNCDFKSFAGVAQW